MAYKLLHPRKVLPSVLAKGTWKGCARSQVVLFGNRRVVVRRRVFLLVSRCSLVLSRVRSCWRTHLGFGIAVDGPPDLGFIGSYRVSSSRWHSLESVSLCRSRSQRIESLNSISDSTDTIYLATYNYLGDVYDKYSVSRADCRNLGDVAYELNLYCSHRLKQHNRFCVIFSVLRSPSSAT